MATTHARTNSTQSANGRVRREDGDGATTAYGTSAASKNQNGIRSTGDDARVKELQDELERTQAEKETLEGQYRTLLDRLSEMKSKIGLKLQQDAVRLARYICNSC